MAYAYSLRTDKCFSEVKALIESKPIGGWAVREVSGDNEHWHWYLQTDIKIQALRNEFNRKIPELKGNGAYSLTLVKDTDKYLRYMAKGEDRNHEAEVAWRNGILYSEEYIHELHEAYWAENARLKKRKVGTSVDAATDKCKELQINWHDRAKIAEVYIRELHSRNKPISTFSVKSAVNVISIHLCPDDAAIKQLAEACYQL
jgi:hypothetical protein